jgi:copper chaperone
VDRTNKTRSDMKKQQFKTTINCAGCLAKVTPFLNEKLSPEEWNVDTLTPSKILTVETDKMTAEEIEVKVKAAGFKIERLD